RIVCLRVVEAQQVVHVVQRVARLVVAARMKREHGAEAELRRNGPREHCLACPRLTGHEERLFDGERGVDRGNQLRIGQIPSRLTACLAALPRRRHSVSLVPYPTPSPLPPSGRYSS